MTMEVFFCTGTEPGKWFDRYHENTTHPELITTRVDDALGAFLTGVEERARGEASDASAPVPVALVRLPDVRLTDEMHRVVLYTEQPGIAVGKETELAEMEPERVSPAEVEGEIVNWAIGEDRQVDVPAVRDALAVAAAGVGIVLAPRPLLKVLSKKQIRHFPFVSDRSTDIALVWLVDDDCDAIQDLVGTMKGRTRGSSRGSVKAGANAAAGSKSGAKRGSVAATASTKRTRGGGGGDRRASQRRKNDRGRRNNRRR